MPEEQTAVLHNSKQSGISLLRPHLIRMLFQGNLTPNMKITFLGHAGLFFETATATVLCDPWFNPAYFASWFPFPSNGGLDVSQFSSPDFLYISHEHRDHLDAKFLRDNVSKDATVLLPDFPISSLRDKLTDLGFHSFLQTSDCEPLDIGGLSVAITALVAPSDGPEGDSAILLDDGHTKVFNQNDARPVNLDQLVRLGPFDAHFLQFSGAIWYPMVYRMDPMQKANLHEEKVANQSRRALDYIESVNASHVFPSAGPPCFLDENLFHLNDLEETRTIFEDQSKFLEYMKLHSNRPGHLVIPGTTIEFSVGGCRIKHPLPQDQIDEIFQNKERYLRTYAREHAPRIEQYKKELPKGNANLLEMMKKRLDPLLADAPHTCRYVDARALFHSGEFNIVIDFQEQRVRAWSGEHCPYVFWVDEALLEHCLLHEDDWVNSLFLSCRFEAAREGKFNEYLYNFFKCLSPKRLEYAEQFYASEMRSEEKIELDGHCIQRYCPHLGADLNRFGSVENGILTCSMHGFKFDLSTGECLNSRLHRLRVYRRDGSEGER